MLGKKMRHFHRERVRINAVELVRMFCQFREKDSAAVTNFEQPGGMRAALNRPGRAQNAAFGCDRGPADSSIRRDPLHLWQEGLVPAAGSMNPMYLESRCDQLLLGPRLT